MVSGMLATVLVLQVLRAVLHLGTKLSCVLVNSKLNPTPGLHLLRAALQPWHGGTEQPQKSCMLLGAAHI